MKKELNKGLLVLVVILSLLVVGLSSYLIYDKVFKEDGTVNDEKDNINNKEGDDEQEQLGTKTINLYKYKDYPSSYIHTLKSGENVEGREYIGNYDCNSKDCDIVNTTSNYVLVKDDGYYLYDYKKDEIKKLNVDNIYKNMTIIEHEEIIYGVIFDNDYYSFKTNKILNFDYDFVYGYNGINIINDYLFAQDGCNNSADAYNGMYTNCEHDYVINSNTGEIVKELNIDDEFIISTIGSKENMYFTEAFSRATTSYGKIYDKNFNLILDGNFGHFDIFVRKGNLILDNNNSFEIYDNNGNKQYTSKQYKKVYNFLEDYIIVLDNDNYVKLIDYSENVIANYIEMKDNYEFSEFASGYYDGGETKISGVYAVIQDKNENDYEKQCKEYYYEFSTGKVGMIEAPCGGYAKPVLYLYPEKETEISVYFEKPYLLTTTYPKYSNYWKVNVKPNGDLYDKDNKYYYGLYWEEKGSIDVSFEEGFYVTKDNAIDFLEEKLSVLGLTARESNEFIMYWLPILEKNEKNLVYFELTESRDNYNKLLINPVPDSLLRIAIHIKKVDKELNIREQKLPSFERKGFVAIEWGGVIHN